VTDASLLETRSRLREEIGSIIPISGTESFGESAQALVLQAQLKLLLSRNTAAEAESIMRAAQVRRLPVVDAESHVIGLLSLNDIAREVARERGASGQPEVGSEEVAETLGAICTLREHRSSPSPPDFSEEAGTGTLPPRLHVQRRGRRSGAGV
jgi:hypothetical protein